MKTTIALACAAALIAPSSASAIGDTTPPTSAASPPAFAAGPSFEIPYSASDDDGGSGVASVDLYVRTPGELTFSATPVATDTTPDTPSFTYEPTAGDGDYAFYTVAVDNDLNSELPPLMPDGTTTVDSSPPSSTASAPASVGTGPIGVTYSASDGSGVGVSSVELWVKAPGDGSYSQADTDTSPDSPSFSYTPSAGDGTYSFYTLAVDSLGNREGAPSQPDAQTVRDTTAPTSTANAPAAVASGSIPVTYSVSGDADTVELWVKSPNGNDYSLAATDSSPASQSFSYTPTAGDGTYSFYTVAVDALGNREAPPAQPDAQTTRDTLAPSSTASAPAAVASGSIPVTYSVSGDADTVELWVKAPSANGYSLASTDSSPASPSFSYAPSAGDGTYSFYTVAVDALGNRENAPSQPDAQTTRDTTAPSSTASAPASSGEGSIPVTYSVAGTDVASVELWVKAPGDGSYSRADADTSPESPSFSYSPAAGDGTYSFYTVAVDTLGNREGVPNQPDAQTTRDTVAPSSTASAPAAVAGRPVSVSYAISGDVASVELWVKGPGDNGYTRADTDSSPGSPSFDYNPSAGDGTYSFYTVAIDSLGNREAAPSQPDAQTDRDTAAPSSSATAPASVGSGPIAISYTDDDGSGTGVEHVELWAQAPGDTGFTLAATDSTPDSPSFDYTATAGDGTYFFYTVAVDRVGNREPAPATADSRTQRDTAAPPPPPPPAPTVVAQLPASGSSTATPATATSESAPSLPLVAALALEGKQTLRTAVSKGLVFRVYAYRPVRLDISATLTKRSAKQVGLQHRPVVARHSFDFAKPAVYRITLRLNRPAVQRLRRAKTARLTVRSRLSGPSGSSTSISSLLLRAR